MASRLPAVPPLRTVREAQGLGLREAARRAGIDHGQLSRVERGQEGLSVEALARLAGGDYALVFVGPLYKFHRGDSNEERAAVELMRRFDGWRERCGFALLTEVHLRKPAPNGGTFTIHEFFGSSAYTRGAEIVLGLRRLRPGYARLHFFKDRDGDLPVGTYKGLLFDRDEGFRVDPQHGQPTTAEQLEALREAEPNITQEQAARAIGVTERTIRKYWREPEDDPQGRLVDED